MWPNRQFPADFVTLTEEIRNGKLHFCAVCYAGTNDSQGSKGREGTIFDTLTAQKMKFLVSLPLSPGDANLETYSQFYIHNYSALRIFDHSACNYQAVTR